MSAKPIIILERDEAARACLEDMFRREDLDVFCHVSDVCDVVSSKTCEDGQTCIALVARGEDDDFDEGAPEYMVKPVRVGALLDRIRQHLRRGQASIDEQDLEFSHYRLVYRDNALVDVQTEESQRLTDKERDILVILHKADGQIVDRKILLDDVWGYAESVETHTLETHIYRLRQKIETDSSKPVLLVTEEPGYRLVIDGA